MGCFTKDGVLMAIIEAIESHYLEVDTASVTFSSLGSYEHLQLRMSARHNNYGFMWQLYDNCYEYLQR